MLILLSLVVSASAAMDGYIVGGQTASIEKWPFITFIEVTQSGLVVSGCGGSLLSSQTVLTAAHCLDDVTKKKELMYETTFAIYMGHTHFEDAVMSRKVVDYETHIRYDPDDSDVRHDVGIMFLEAPVTFVRHVKKIILQRRFNRNVDRELEVAGWGTTDPKGGPVNERLKSVGLKPAVTRLCEKMHKVICTASNDHEYAFSGDSGGPMVNAKTHQQLGIVSFRDEGTGMTVFTSIPDYWSWINRTQVNLFKRNCGK